MYSYRGDSINPISRPELNYRIKKEPVVIVNYLAIFDDGSVSDLHYSLTTLKSNLFSEESQPIAHQKITITDGVATVEIVK